MDERQHRIGENEILFRDVNERLKDVSEGFAVILPTLSLVCECGQVTCTERIDVSIEEYERVRADPRLFFVRTGHEVDDVERVIEERGGWSVIEKRAGEPAQFAVEHDPRA